MPLARIYLSRSDRPWSEYNGLGQNLSVCKIHKTVLARTYHSWSEVCVSKLCQLFLINWPINEKRRIKEEEAEEEKTVTGGFLLD